MGAAHIPDYLLLTQVFPPAVGGSGVLLDNVYSRVGHAAVTGLVGLSEDEAGRQSRPSFRLVGTQFDPHSWSLFDMRGWPRHFALARAIYQRASRGRAIVHCGRAQPEAVPALLASTAPGGPPYLFWVHGEDITAARSSRAFDATLRLVYRGACAAIANSRNTASMVKAIGWLRGDVHVVYPGVDAARFCPDADDGGLRRRLAPNGQLVLMSISRLQKRKGHALVLKALPEVCRRVPNIRYVIVGAGDERETLEDLTRSLGIGACVEFVGEVSDEELPAYFSACDIFLLPTRVEPHDFEGFGIVYLEAAAAGKPTVGGRNGGVPEAVDESETGLLVSGDDVGELVQAVLQLCQSEPLRRRMGTAGRARVLRSFTWERAAAAVTDIHLQLAGHWSR